MVSFPVVAAKYVVSMYAAPDPVPPQVLLMLPRDPRVRLPTLRFCAAATLAVAVPEGAILRLPDTEVPAGIVFAPLPEKIRLLYAVAVTVCTAPL
jgi:hypothetical protein